MFADKSLRRIFYKDGSIGLWIDDKQTGILKLSKHNMELKWRLIKNESLYSIHTYANGLLISTEERWIEDGIDLIDIKTDLMCKFISKHSHTETKKYKDMEAISATFYDKSNL